MQTIKALSKALIQKIAAGEVVERPASVVKELVENALDARARQIEIVVEKAGTRKIEVIDDGHGMVVADLRKCYLPHTTSKIASEHDLFAINSMGFRGEALASIAAVAQVTIKSKTSKDKLGSQVAITKGKAKPATKAGMPTGTTVTVEHLFSSVPARRKFLSSAATELKHITRIVTDIALAHHDVGFVLRHNGKVVFELPDKQTRAQRVSSLLGDTFVGAFAIEHRSPHVAVIGLLGGPSQAIKSKNKQYIFVNNRPVSNTAIAGAVKNGFGTLLPQRLHPVFALFIDLPPHSVDVNIHPRKEEVKFANQAQVTDMVRTAVERALRNREQAIDDTVYDQTADFSMMDVLRASTDSWDPRSIAQKTKGEVHQINKLYLVQATDKGILVVDQHAAHERVLYEQFSNAFDTIKKQTIYALPTAVTFDVPQTDHPTFEARLATMTSIGFDIEHFGGLTYKVNAVPHVFKDRDIQKLVTELTHELNHERDSISERTIAYLACRSAIKAGDTLKPKERKELIKKLMKTDNNQTCPHGRPTYVMLSLEMLNKVFGR